MTHIERRLLPPCFFYDLSVRILAEFFSQTYFLISISKQKDLRALVEIVLEARNLIKTYPGATTPALDRLDVTIRAGEIFGLLGPNGAGKTTAISIMSTLMRPDNGSVKIFGIDCIHSPQKARKIISLVPQDIALYQELTINENLRFFGKQFGLSGKVLKKRIGECLDFVGLEKRAEQKIYSFSGGMKRRANLAAGLLNKPKLLFLDEPTVGIDAQSRNLILERLSLLKNEGTTMVYTTHYMEEAERLCTVVKIIDEGQSIANGCPAELIKQKEGCANLQDLFFSLTGKSLRD